MNAIYILWLRQLETVRALARAHHRLPGPAPVVPVRLRVRFRPSLKAGQGNYIQFLAPGVICMTILFTAIFSGIELIWDRQFGFFKEMLVAPVPRILIMVGANAGGRDGGHDPGADRGADLPDRRFPAVDWSALPLAFCSWS